MDESALRRCFAAVFPDLPEDEIERAEVGRVAAWDSLAALTLAAVLEEEFELEIDELELPELRSYAAVREYLQGNGRLPA